VGCLQEGDASLPVVPLALLANWFAYRQNFVTHRRITRVLAPIWVYVSVTGVLVYFFLYQWWPSAS
jgi:putative membrane protein